MAANAAGADAVKLQKRSVAADLADDLGDSPYDNHNSFGKTYREHREKLELSPDAFAHLKDRIRYNRWNLTLFPTVCDIESANQMEMIGFPVYKIASRDIDNIPLIDHVARFGKPMILSTGMADWQMIDEAVGILEGYGVPFVLMQCTTCYPCEEKDANLAAIPAIRDRYGCLVGFSDHTQSETLPAAAVAMGACVIEKHLTLSQEMPGSDHKASLEPEPFRRMVKAIRDFETARGTGEKTGVADEQTKIKLGRSFVTVKPIAAGEIIDETDVTLKSPGGGFAWSDRGELFGAIAKRDIPANRVIRTEWVYDKPRLPLAMIDKKAADEIMGPSAMNEAEDYTESYQRRHTPEMRKLLGVFRWRGLHDHFDLIAPMLRKAQTIIDLGGADCPVVPWAEVSDKQQNDCFGRRTIGLHAFGFDLFFSSHCMEHLDRDPGGIFSWFYADHIIAHVPSWTCKRWRAENYDNANQPNGHKRNFSLSGEDTLGIETVRIDEFLSQWFDITFAENVGDNSILVIGKAKQ